MPVSVRTQKHIWGLFAGRCAICRNHLVHVEGVANTLLGEVAHIVGEKPGAARGDHPMSMDNRSHADNLMLLCQADHKIIDDNPDLYPIERLRLIQRDFLCWLAGKLSPQVKWATTISQYLYLNVPRLDEFSTLSGFVIHRPAQTDAESLHQAGHSIYEFMECYRHALEQTTFAAVDLGSIAFAHEDYVGQIVSIDHMWFESRGLPHDRDDFFGSPDFGAKGRRPTLTWASSDVSLSLMIDSRWITTTTAYLLFTPQSGIVILSGFARITSVDYAAQTMTATALALGVPVSAGRRAAPALPRSSYARGPTDLSHFEDNVTKARGQIWESDEPDYCGLCQKCLVEDVYMVDGSTNRDHKWAIMCARCFSLHGSGIGIGHGQLYRRDQREWLLVGGMPEPLY